MTENIQNNSYARELWMFIYHVFQGGALRYSVVQRENQRHE